MEQKVREINDSILELWNKVSPQLTNHKMPVFYSEEIKRGGLLFVGINPSYSERGLTKMVNDMDCPDLDISSFFSHPNNGSFSPEKSNAMNKYAEEKYAYFAKFRHLAKELKKDWAHIDLFVLRETSQKSMVQRIFEKVDKKIRLNSFAVEQLEIAKKMIKIINPTAIVVANAQAGHIMLNSRNGFPITDFDQQVGHHHYDIDGELTPIFFTSMLTGQRALDNYSFERLQWHLSRSI